MPRPSVSRFATRPPGPFTSAIASRDAAHEQRRHQAGVEAARPDDDGVEPRDGLGGGGMDRRRRLEPEARAIALPPRCPASTSTSPCVMGRRRTRRRAGAFGAHRPHAARAAEQRAQAVDGGQEVAAVLLHHRQQQVAAGVAADSRWCRASAAAPAARAALRSRSRASASAHLSTSPGGSTPSSSRSDPELPPLSNIVTTAWTCSHGLRLARPAGSASRCRRRSSRRSTRGIACRGIVIRTAQLVTATPRASQCAPCRPGSRDRPRHP